MSLVHTSALRRLRRYFGTLLAAVLLLVAGCHKPAPKVSPPIASGPFHLQSWLLPDEFEGAGPVLCLDQPGFAVTTGIAGAVNEERDYNQILHMLPDGHGGLTVAEQLQNRTGQLAAALTADGRILIKPQKNIASGAYAEQHGEWQLLPLSGDTAKVKPTDFDLGFQLEGNYFFKLLNAQRMAGIQSVPGPPARSNLWIAPAGQPAKLVQTISEGLLSGQVWHDGNTIGLCTKSHKLYVLDKNKERLVELPEAAPLVQAAMDGTPFIRRFYYCGNFMLTTCKERDALRLFASDGSQLKIDLFNPEKQNPDGTPRAEESAASGGEDAAAESGGTAAVTDDPLRSEGRLAPLTAFSRGYGETVLCTAPNQVMLFDSFYDRITIINCVTP